MDIKYGAEVVDSKGEVVGSVDHLANDPWSGEVKSFIIRRKSPATDLFIRPEHVEEATESQVKLNFTVDD
jgi:sporulation protein YlmC with PRC-barrel domain